MTVGGQGGDRGSELSAPYFFVLPVPVPFVVVSAPESRQGLVVLRDVDSNIEL